MSDDPSYQRIKAVLKANGHELLNRKYVNYVCTGYKTVRGQKTDQLGIIIAVKGKKPESLLSEDELLPRFFHGCPTDIVEREVVDPFKNFNKN